MKPFLVLLAALSLTASLAAQTYVVAENEKTSGNSATVYSLNTTTGVTTAVKQLSTGGGGLGGGFFAGVTEAIAQNAKCVFIADTGTNDIAAFASPTYAKVGNYSNAALNWSASGAGGSIALSPNGHFLYGSYSGSENIGAWKVASTCALTFVNSYTPSTGPDLFATLKVTPNGADLIVPSIDLSLATEFSINQTTGALTEISNVSFASLATCSNGCFPYGMDISGNSEAVVFGDPTTTNGGIYAMSANISATALSNPQAYTLTNTAGVENSTVPFYPASTYPTGIGPIAIGMSGYFNPIENAGVVVANINPTAGTLHVLSSSLFATPDSSCNGCTGSLRIHGALAVSAQIPNLINVYSINPSTGAFTLLKSNVDSTATGLLSIDVYPNTR